MTLHGRRHDTSEPSRRRIARSGVVLCVALATALAAVYWAKAVDLLSDAAARNAALSYEDREFGGGNSFVVDKRALYEARGHIREDETYRVVTGPAVVGATELTEPYIDQFARSFLMPRRPAPDARWVLCYGCDLAQLGGELDVVWQNGAGIALGRLGP